VAESSPGTETSHYDRDFLLSPGKRNQLLDRRIELRGATMVRLERNVRRSITQSPDPPAAAATAGS